MSHENLLLCDFEDDIESDRHLSVPKMLSGANAFEISDIERMNIRAGRVEEWRHAP